MTPETHAALIAAWSGAVHDYAYGKGTVGSLMKHGANLVEALQTAGAWQPIETAPKDGTGILLSAPVGFGWRIVGGSWNCGDSLVMPHWMSPVAGFQPTHWMPLAAPPLTEGKD